jgi:hypothetical protein
MLGVISTPPQYVVVDLCVEIENFQSPKRPFTLRYRRRIACAFAALPSPPRLCVYRFVVYRWCLASIAREIYACKRYMPVRDVRL